MNNYLHPYRVSLFTPITTASQNDQLTSEALRAGLTRRDHTRRPIAQRIRGSVDAMVTAIGDRRIPTNPAPTASYYELAFHRSRHANAR